MSDCDVKAAVENGDIGYFAVRYAAENGDLDTLKLLLNVGAPISTNAASAAARSGRSSVYGSSCRMRKHALIVLLWRILPETVMPIVYSSCWIEGHPSAATL